MEYIFLWNDKARNAPAPLSDSEANVLLHHFFDDILHFILHMSWPIVSFNSPIDSTEALHNKTIIKSNRHASTIRNIWLRSQLLRDRKLAQ